jgi:hypothetical protein
MAGKRSSYIFTTEGTKDTEEITAGSAAADSLSLPSVSSTSSVFKKTRYWTSSKFPDEPTQDDNSVFLSPANKVALVTEVAFAKTPATRQNANVLLILATNSAAAKPYAAAANKLGAQFLLGLEVIPSASREIAGVLPLQFGQREAALEIVEHALKTPIAAIVAADERAAPACARASSMMGFKWHSPRAADLCLDQAALLHGLRSTGFNVPSLAQHSHRDEIGVAAIFDRGKMRVVGALDRKDASAAALLKPRLESLLAAARKVGFSHGPLWASLHGADETATIYGLSPVIPAEHHAALQFRIPLVDESVSLAEVIVRHALGMDISRICAISRK